ncbi:hypothetical protein HYQ44_002408 [Verticillium longisporum]|nr:hypothetical protein HYQ44_002408 [Verticillium longisporum]
MLAPLEALLKKLNHNAAPVSKGAESANYDDHLVFLGDMRERLGKIWDHAGAMLMFQEAGGKVTDVDGREPDLTAGRKMIANFGWVAAPAGVHAEILAAVQDAVRAEGHGDLLRPLE